MIEFRPKEKMIGHITEIKNPSIGKANNDIEELPKSAKNKHTIVIPVVPTSTFRLSNIFNKTSPKIQPMVNIAQKYATVLAPKVCGSI